MLKLPFILASAFTKSAQLRARILMQKAMIVAVAAGLAIGGISFLISAIHIALTESVGAMNASLIVGFVMLGLGIAVFLYNRRKLEQVTPDVGNPLHAAAAIATDPDLSNADGKTRVTPAQALSATVDPDRLARSPAEAAVQAALAGDYATAAKHATAAGKELGESVPPMAFPAAGLAIGLALAWSRIDKKDD